MVGCRRRRLELYFTGTATAISLTTTVDGRPVAAQDVPLSYARVVDVPHRPTQTAWRVDYHLRDGDFFCSVLVDGVLVVNHAAGAGGTAEPQDHVEGVV